MEETAAAAPSLPSLAVDGQPMQAQLSVEQELFEYLIDVEKGFGIDAPLADPSVLFGETLEKLDEVAKQAQTAFDQAGRPAGNAAGEAQEGEVGSTAKAGNREENIAQLLDELQSLMWASANVLLATNGLSAATSSLNKLVHQQ